MSVKPKITPFLWFNNEAEEAAKFYTSVFPKSRITNLSRYTEAGPRPAGGVMVVTFELDGREFAALNGGPEFPFSEAVSFMVNCETQEEVDYYWEKLSAGGREDQCGWLKDKFGLSWQIVPTALGELMSEGDPDSSRRVMEALLKMKKLDIRALEEARGR